MSSGPRDSFEHLAAAPSATNREIQSCGRSRVGGSGGDMGSPAETQIGDCPSHGHGHGPDLRVSRETDRLGALERAAFELDLAIHDREVAFSACDELITICRALYALCGESVEAQRLMGEAEAHYRKV